jgi:hypothetical protein
MQKLLAAALLASLAVVGCGGKTAAITQRDPGAAEPPPYPDLPDLQPDPGAAEPPTPPPAPTGNVPVPPCSTSFRAMILPTMLAHSCTASACHGGPVPRNEPLIDPADALGTWSGLHAFTLSTGQPYLAKGTTTPAASAMHCHLRGECGTSMLAFVAGAAFSPQELADVDDWLACGAPFD